MSKKEESNERKATWTELFFDLAFVVAVRAFSHELALHFNFEGLLIFILIFIPLWWAWAGHTFYNDRFDTDDLISRGFSILQMLAVLGLALFAHDALTKNFSGFALSYIAARGILIAYYLKTAIKNIAAKPLAINYSIGFSLALIPWVFAMALPQFRIPLIILGLVIDIGTPFTQFKNQAKLPLSISHLPERFGLFTILVMGEILVASVNATSGLKLSYEIFIGILVAILSALLIWTLYFKDLEAKFLKNIKWASQIWVYLHLPLMISIASLAVGIEKVIHSVGEDHLNFEALTFSAITIISAVLIIVGMNKLKKN